MTLTEEERLELRQLEEALWREGTRFDHAFMEGVLASDFIEFGRSGRVYTREQCLAVPPRPFAARLPLRGFRVRSLAAGVALVTYVSEARFEELELEVANRSSVWTRDERGWQLRFHQGTPTTLPDELDESGVSADTSE
jgi:hypothetical protein